VGSLKTSDAPGRGLLITTSVPSTVTAFLLPYVEHFRQLGWRVEAASNGITAAPKCVAAFDAVHDVPWTRSPTDLVNVTTAADALRRIVREGRFDLVHTHDPVAAFITRFALRHERRAGRPKVVYTAHGFHFYRGAPLAQGTVFKVVERLASSWTDHLIVINQEDLASARRFPLARKGKVSFMPGIGIDCSVYSLANVSSAEVERIRRDLGLVSGQPLFTMIAEFNPGKRHRDAVAALAASDLPTAVLALAGEGPLMQEVRALEDAEGVGDRVRLLGYRNDIPALVAASAAVLLPSEREGLPRSLMEASALERPVIASRIRGVSELVTERTGFLHEVGDVGAIAAALRAVVNDPEGMAEMGRAGRRAMERYDVKNLLALHDALYASLLGDR